MTSQPPTSGPELAKHRLDLGNPLRDRILTAIDADEPATEPRHLLAQMNIARFRATMDDPSMAGFVEMLDPINHHAEAADGFVWRLTDGKRGHERQSEGLVDALGRETPIEVHEVKLAGRSALAWAGRQLLGPADVSLPEPHVCIGANLARVGRQVFGKEFPEIPFADKADAC